MKNKILNIYYSILAYFAKIYIKKHKPYIIGINGSVGKTSCRMIIYQTLQKFITNKKIYTSSKNFNGELGLSLSIFQIENFYPSLTLFISVFFKILRKTIFSSKPYDILILEYGIDRPKEMEFLLKIANPHIGIFTAIDSVHSQQFGDPAQIAKEEIKMIKNTLEIAFLNENDAYAMQLIHQINIDYFTYQTLGHESKADISFSDIHFQSDGYLPILSEFNLKIKNQKYNIQTNLIGKPNYGYIGVALAIAQILAYKFNNISNLNFDDLELEYLLQAGRFSIFAGISKSIIFDSSYNSSPLSVRKIIDTVYNIQKEIFPKRKIWFLLGDMRELGDLTEKEHRLLAGYVSQTADRLFLVGENMINHLSDELQKVGYDKKLIYKFHKSTDAGEVIAKMLKDNPDEILLICKGSQNTIFLEEGIKKLLNNSEDEKYLTRQSKWRIKTKNNFFQS
ncbi:MAG: Mur ligase family protein [Candidatus Absconditabacterales bacterium]